MRATVKAIVDVALNTAPATCLPVPHRSPAATSNPPERVMAAVAKYGSEEAEARVADESRAIYAGNLA